ncbi:polyhomeotic-like protein 2 [Pelodytes ibericus]
MAAHGGIQDRPSVQVIQQALHRQPSTAAQYLQQMYAAQQQHLMLQTVALQQQHLSSSAPLQSMPTVQQACRRGTPPMPNVSQQSQTQPQMRNLMTSPQIISRSQTVSSSPTTGITQQAVRLGSTTSPALSASQAQMYLRAQMLIFTPSAPVTSVQTEANAAGPSQTPVCQVQNLAVRGRHTVCAGQLNTQSHLPSMAIKPPSANHILQTVSTPSHSKPATHMLLPAIRGGTTDKKGETHGMDTRDVASRAVALVNSHSIITPHYTPVSPLVQPPVSPVTPQPNGQRGDHRPGLSEGLSQDGESVTTRTTPPAQESPQMLSAASQRKVMSHMPLPVSHVTLSPSQTPHIHKPLSIDCTSPVLPDLTLDMTSGNGSSSVPAAATGTPPQNGDNKPLPAVVTPQILTHVIEGFVIQEGAHPFPSHRSRGVIETGRASLLLGAPGKYQLDNNTTDSEMEESLVPGKPESREGGEPPKLKCELCGRVDFEYKFKRSKRFCSMACAKRYNVGCTKRVGLFHPDRSKLQKAGAARHARRPFQKANVDPKKQVSGSVTPLSSGPLSASAIPKHTNSKEDSSQCSDNSSYEDPLSPASANSSLSQQQNERNLEIHGGGLTSLNSHFLPSNPTQWKVADVYEFIRALPGCREISEEFRAQEIDGQALLLLREEHLMSTMNIKLGPALKLYAQISSLRDS